MSFYLKTGVVTLGLLGLMMSAPAVSHPALITEFMASNDSVIADDDGDFSDWIEVHNESGALLDLTGYYLTDDPLDLTKWQFPAVSIPAGGYLLNCQPCSD